MEFQCGVAAVTLLRYLAEAVTKLPLPALSRLLVTHDTPLAMVPLIENPPWVRKVKVLQRTTAPAASATAGSASVSSSTGTTTGTESSAPGSATSPAAAAPPAARHVEQWQWQKFTDGAWKPVDPASLLKLTSTEGQPWLCLYNLLCEPEVRKRYALHAARKSALLRVRRFINEVSSFN
jgi:hypothetical protein